MTKVILGNLSYLNLVEVVWGLQKDEKVNEKPVKRRGY